MGRDKLVQLAVFGYRAHALERADGALPEQRMPLPAACILQVCDLGLATANTYLRIQCAGLALAFVLFNRPGAAASLRRRDVAFTDNGLELQLVDFKMALRTGREHMAYTVPIDWQPGRPDRFADLLHLVVRDLDAAGSL
ncbi:hypothetical protein MMPV_006230 [Pyropia vietnamensis]